MPNMNELFKNKYKIIFVDIDGTILDHSIHDWDYETINYLRELQSRGVLIYLCTARPYDSILSTGLLNFYKPDGIVATNGGVAFDGNKVIFANVIPEDIVREVERVANRHHLVLELATTTERHFTAKVNSYVEKYFTVYLETKPKIIKYDNKDVSAILMFAPEKFDEKLKQELPKEMDYLRFDAHGVDVGYHRNTKGEGIRRVLEYLNIDKKYAIGVGDSFDDITMFRACGLSLAMGNGSEETRQAADIVCDTVTNHGLKQELIKHFE